jgi:hypothetical protein
MTRAEDLARGSAVLLLVLGIGFGAGVLWVRRDSDREAQAAQVQAAKHKEAADAARSEAQALTLRDAENVTAREAAERKLAQIRSEAQRPRPAQPQQDPAPLPVVDPDPVDLAPVVAAQDVLIVSLKAENSTLRLECAAWKRDADESRARAGALEVALRAKTEGLTAAKWINRAEGFAVGAALGYAGGRCR